MKILGEGLMNLNTLGPQGKYMNCEDDFKNES